MAHLTLKPLLGLTSHPILKTLSWVLRSEVSICALPHQDSHNSKLIQRAVMLCLALTHVWRETYFSWLLTSDIPASPLVLPGGQRVEPHCLDSAMINIRWLLDWIKDSLQSTISGGVCEDLLEETGLLINRLNWKEPLSAWTAAIQLAGVWAEQKGDLHSPGTGRCSSPLALWCRNSKSCSLSELTLAASPGLRTSALNWELFHWLSWFQHLRARGPLWLISASKIVWDSLPVDPLYPSIYIAY